MKILLTAFDPFGGEKINPAQEALKKIQSPSTNQELIKLVVPTVFGLSIQTVCDAIQKHQPDVVICIGQAGGRPAITIEQIAINLIDASIPDNQGNQPTDQPVSAGGPDGYFSTLPVKNMVNAVRGSGIPASVSYSAGTFVCNQLMYGVLHYLHHNFPQTRGGFIHIPYLPAQTVSIPRPTPSMSLEDMVKGLEAALCVL